MPLCFFDEYTFRVVSEKAADPSIETGIMDKYGVPFETELEMVDTYKKLPSQVTSFIFSLLRTKDQYEMQSTYHELHIDFLRSVILKQESIIDQLECILEGRDPEE